MVRKLKNSIFFKCICSSYGIPLSISSVIEEARFFHVQREKHVKCIDRTLVNEKFNNKKFNNKNTIELKNDPRVWKWKIRLHIKKSLVRAISFLRETCQVLFHIQIELRHKTCWKCFRFSSFRCWNALLILYSIRNNLDNLSPPLGVQSALFFARAQFRNMRSIFFARVLYARVVKYFCKKKGGGVFPISKIEIFPTPLAKKRMRITTRSCL